MLIVVKYFSALSQFFHRLKVLAFVRVTLFEHFIAK